VEYVRGQHATAKDLPKTLRACLHVSLYSTNQEIVYSFTAITRIHNTVAHS
jgi:hypothetical protein